MFSKKEEKRAPYTVEQCESCKKETKRKFIVEQCESCKKETKRKFIEGDYIFKETSPCVSCKGQLRITKIFGEIIKT